MWCLTNSNEYFKSVTAYRIVTSLNAILKQLHYSQGKIAEIGGFSPKTISKIINHYDLKIKSVTTYRIVTSLFCNIEISEALLNKAGIHWCNTLVSNVCYEILTYTR